MSLEIDTREQDRFLRRYNARGVETALTVAAAAGGKAGAAVLRSAAPVGKSARQSQYYRKSGLGHGTFKKSVTSRKIRGRSGALNVQGQTVGVVIGPIGKNAFTRYWIEAGTKGPGQHRQRANPWVERSADETFRAARVATDNMLEAYAKVVR